MAIGLLSGGTASEADVRRLAAGIATLSNAARELSLTPATRYRGMITDSNGLRGDVDVRVTNGGSTYGTVTQAGRELRLLAVDGKTYLKGDQDFWRSSGAPADSLGEYAKQWVKVPSEHLGADVQTLLAPAELARRISRTTTSRQVRPGPEVTVNGTRATKLTTPQGTVFVTTTPPHRIVRVEHSADNPAEPGGSRLPGVPVLPDFGPRISTEDANAAAQPGAGSEGGEPAREEEFELDLSDLSPPEVEDLFDDLEDKVRELKNSVDSQVRFALDGSVRLAPCGTSGCTAHVAIRNTVTASSPYLRTRQPVNAAITVNMTLDGRPIRTCTATKRMRPNSSSSTTCHASYFIPPSPRPRTHTVRAVARAVARTVVEADIKRIIEDLKKEKEQQRREVGCATGERNSFTPGTPVLLADGTYRPIEDVDVGDIVWATDPVTGRDGARPVTDLITGQGRKNLVEITVDTDGGNGFAIGNVTATDKHPFWIPALAKWVNAQDLQPGMWLQASTGAWTQITRVQARTAKYQRVHNLTVAASHTYYVATGQASVLVHNSGCVNGYSGHARSRMAQRGISEDMVEQTVRNGKRLKGNTPGTTKYRSGNIWVVLNNRGIVVSVGRN